MKIVFMGTPAFSAGFLNALLQSKHEVITVVTQPDRPAGRGQKSAASPVKLLALSHSLPILQPENLKSPEFEEALGALHADLFVVVAFSILPKNILSLSQFGAVNVHGSILPKYRGAAPVQRAILSGESETGVTVFLLDEKMDHGPILERRTIAIASDDTTTSLLDKMLPPGIDALFSALDAIESGAPQFLPQRHEQATAAPKIRKEEGKIDFSRKAFDLHNLIRAFFPWPGAYATLGGKTAYLRKARIFSGNDSQTLPELSPGEIFCTKEKMFVGTGEGILEVISLQLEGKREMPAADFFRGARLEKGMRFC